MQMILFPEEMAATTIEAVRSVVLSPTGDGVAGPTQIAHLSLTHLMPKFRFQFPRIIPTRGCSNIFLTIMGTILAAMVMLRKKFAVLEVFSQQGGISMDFLTNRTELIAEMFKAYVTNNELE